MNKSKCIFHLVIVFVFGIVSFSSEVSYVSNPEGAFRLYSVTNVNGTLINYGTSYAPTPEDFSLGDAFF